jgi:hypothetical protein
MAAQQWYTLVRFRGTPDHLTGVSQAQTPRDALAQLAQWETAYPEDSTVVFTPENHPIDRRGLVAAIPDDPGRKRCTVAE